MEVCGELALTEARYRRIGDCLSRQPGNVSDQYLRVLNAIPFVVEPPPGQAGAVPCGRELLRVWGAGRLRAG